MRPLVIDTNVVLDLLVFGDPRTASLRAALDAGEVRWVATDAMRDELVHVLAYPNFVQRPPGAVAVLEAFDRQSMRVDCAPRAAIACRDTDDQKFVDLAVAHAGLLLSKDKEVLRLKRKLEGVRVTALAMYP